MRPEQVFLLSALVVAFITFVGLAIHRTVNRQAWSDHYDDHWIVFLMGPILAGLGWPLIIAGGLVFGFYKGVEAITFRIFRERIELTEFYDKLTENKGGDS